MSFAKSLSIVDEMTDEINREARALGINLLNGLTRVTPVDTGRARGNWFVGINKSNRSIDQERKAAQAIIDGVSDITSSKFLDYPEIVLSNNLPYIERLNDGYSLQAPKKFIESEIDRVVNASNRR
tara:strand:+ start:1931 stop:2308 length:378 start_codon:yes stop_codon:yes gene_type:complete